MSEDHKHQGYYQSQIESTPYQATKGLTEKQLEILQLIDKNPGISLTELAKKQGTGVSMIHRRIAGLRKQGYIRQSMYNVARDLQLTAKGEEEVE